MPYTAEGHLHFHPDVVVKKVKEGILLNGNVLVQFIGQDSVVIKSYEFAAGFNKMIAAKKCTYTFKDKITVHIKLYL